MNEMMNKSTLYAMNKFQELQENKALVWILVLIIALFFAYAFYCTSKGYDFSGTVKKSGKYIKIGCFT